MVCWLSPLGKTFGQSVVFPMALPGPSFLSSSFLIGEDGRVYEGRGWRTEGAHTYGYNDLALGIAFIGDFTGKKAHCPLP